VLKKFIFLAVLAFAAMGALSLAGAGAAAKPASASSTPRAANSHPGTSGLVRQVGFRNYAGPNCPGKGWNCTTATRVLQIASPGGSNSFVCSPSNVPVPAPTATNCVIKQIGGSTNTARCTQQSSNADVAQSCDITQSGAANYAYLNQNINQSDGSGQLGKQTASVIQGPASVTNYVQISQAVNQSSKVTNAGTQNQNADQSATVEQTATGSGTNTAALNQTQLQKEYARGTTQTQNTTSNLPDCNTTTVPPGPTHPNACAVVLQHSSAGANANQLRQNVNEDQNSSGQATQSQGSTNGGLDARVHQDTDSGTSTNSAVLSKNQHQTAASGSDQFQHDPVSCCGFASQDGGTNNRETIDLSSSQSASGDSTPQQTSDLIGTSHTPQGTCTITEKASINRDSANNSDTESPTCPFLTLTTFCNVDGCSAPEGDTSNPFPPDSSLFAGVRADDQSPFVETYPFEVFPPATFEYQVLYSNSGSGAAHNVVVTDTLPSGGTPGTNFFNLAYVDLSCTNSCIYDPDARTITWNLGTVDPNTSVDLRFTGIVTGDNCVAVLNNASVDTDEEAPITSNDARVPLACIT